MRGQELTKSPGSLEARAIGQLGRDIDGRVIASSAPFPERVAKGLSADRILANLRARLAGIQEAFFIVIPPPPVQGIGNSGGFKMMIQDKRGRGLDALDAATQDMVAAANQTRGLAGVFSLFNTRTPKLYADIDRVKAEMLGVSAEKVFETLEVLAHGLASPLLRFRYI